LEKFWREHCLGGLLIGWEVARHIVPRGRGTILFTDASGSLRGKAGFAAFAAAKAGLRAVSQSMARELGLKGIHVIDGGIAGACLLSHLPSCGINGDQMACAALRRSPTPIGNCTTSTAASGRRSSICGSGTGPLHHHMRADRIVVALA